MTVTTALVDYQNPTQAKDLVSLLNDYAQDEMGGGEALSEYSQANLAKELAKLPYAFSLIAYVDGAPAGLANCLMGFSTFACKPLVNIHDLAVRSQFRGMGLSQTLLQAVKAEANERGCCKVTLEVLSGNKVAYNAYLKYGFKPYQLDEGTGTAQFLELKLG